MTKFNSMELDVSFPAYHGRISAREAEKRLLSEKSKLSAGIYLVRFCGGKEYAISYLTKKLAVNHLIIPRKKHGYLYKFNPQLRTLQERVDFVSRKFTQHGRFLDCVSYLNFVKGEDIAVVTDGNEKDLKYIPYNQIVCNICDQDVKDQKGHKAGHTIVLCSNCGDMFKQNSLGDHKQKCLEVKVKCDLCDFDTHYRKSLIQHMKALHKADSEKCHECQKSFTSKNKWVNHIQSKHYYHFVCKTCGESFATRQGRNKHNRNKHMTFVLSGDLGDELTYKSLDTNVKFLHRKGESFKDSLSNTELETWNLCFGKTESGRLARNEKQKNRMREKRKKIRDEAEEETICIVFD